MTLKGEAGGNGASLALESGYGLPPGLFAHGSSIFTFCSVILGLNGGMSLVPNCAIKGMKSWNRPHATRMDVPSIPRHIPGETQAGERFPHCVFWTEVFPTPGSPI